MSVKMVVTHTRQNRKREQIRRHRQKFWWKASDNDRVGHLFGCKYCYAWVMRQIRESNVKYGYNEWLPNWKGDDRMSVHINYGEAGGESA